MKRATTRIPRPARPLALLGLLGASLAAAPSVPAQTPVQPQTPAPAVLGRAAADPAPTGPWTLRAAVDYALAHNLNVRQSELTAQQQEANSRLNRAALLPTLGLNATQGFNFGTNRDPFTNQFQLPLNNAFLTPQARVQLCNFALASEIAGNAGTIATGVRTPGRLETLGCPAAIAAM